MDGLMVGQGVVYQRNIGIVKQYTDDYFKLIHMNVYRQKGFEESSVTDVKGKKNTAGNTCKLRSSLSRTKAIIFELAMCNDWDYFVTLTLSEQGHDRHNLEAYRKKLGQWIADYNRRKGANVKYMLIPEPHKDGAWHMHGLISGLPLDHLTAFTLADRIPKRVKKLIRDGRTIYNWSAYAKSFGWVTVEQIHDKNACSKYITKYITKDLADTRIALNDHMYYCSKGLKRSTVVFKDYLKQSFEADFKNEYVAVKAFNNMSEAMQYFCDENSQGGKNEQN